MGPQKLWFPVPKTEYLPHCGVSQLPPRTAYQGWGRNPRPRARDGAAHAGEYQVRVTHAAAPRRCTPVPLGTAQKSLGPFPSLVGQQPGHQSLFPPPRLGVPHLPSGLAPSRGDSSPLMLIKARRGTGQLQGCWKGALRFGGFQVEGSSRRLAAWWARGGGAGRRGNLACRGPAGTRSRNVSQHQPLLAPYSTQRMWSPVTVTSPLRESIGGPASCSWHDLRHLYVTPQGSVASLGQRTGHLLPAGGLP